MKIKFSLIEIIPSILAKTQKEFLEKITAVERLVDGAHIDIADGIFVPNITIGGVEEIKNLDASLKFSVHLMVLRPENHIDHWLETTVDKFVFHIEATKKVAKIIDQLKEADRLAGVALNPSTPISALEPYVDQIDFVHFMTVEPGFYGGEFVGSVTQKIKDFHYYYPDKPIEADGGITPETAPQLIEAGVGTLIVGSYIWQSGDIGEAIKKIESSLVE